MYQKEFLVSKNSFDVDYSGDPLESKRRSRKGLAKFGTASIVASGAMLFFGQTVAGAPEMTVHKNVVAEQKVVVRSNLQNKLKAAKWLSGLVFKEQKKIWAMEDVMQQPHTRIIERRTTALSIPARKQELAKWRTLRAETEDKYRNPPHLADLLCIHSGIKGGRYTPFLEYIGGGEPAGKSKGEASWKNRGIDWRGRPSRYFGGMQMDRPFMEQFAPEIYSTKGTADNWPAIQQIWVAERAVKSDGNFGRWPNTARACGLPTRGHIV